MKPIVRAILASTALALGLQGLNSQSTLAASFTEISDDTPQGANNLPTGNLASTAWNNFTTSLGPAAVTDPVAGNLGGLTYTFSNPNGNLTISFGSGFASAPTLVDGSGGTTASGFNTTGSYGASGPFLRLNSTQNSPATNTITFTFSQPVTAFGLMLTDFGNVPINGVDANDISFQLLDAASTIFSTGTIEGDPQIQEGGIGVASDRSASFVAFTTEVNDPLISSIVFSVNRTSSAVDPFGIDDFAYASAPTAVPVPPQVLGFAVFSLLGALKYKQRRTTDTSDQA